MTVVTGLRQPEIIILRNSQDRTPKPFSWGQNQDNINALGLSGQVSWKEGLRITEPISEKAVHCATNGVLRHILNVTASHPRKPEA